jgi:hypothetical protein
MTGERDPHALTFSGSATLLLKARDTSEEDELTRAIARLDGRELFSVMLWALPPGISLDRVDLEQWPRSFIQAAGSAERMTIEVCVDGDPPHHAILGRTQRPGAADPMN